LTRLTAALTTAPTAAPAATAKPAAPTAPDTTKPGAGYAGVKAEDLPNVNAEGLTQ
jgi:hypothetical protein